MNAVVRLAVAFAAGAVAMYYLDPLKGRRRRAMMRERGVVARHDVERFARTKSKQVVDRVQGVVARTRSRLAEEAVDDDLLRERIRGKLGHLVEHPSALTVEVKEGVVSLSGTAAESEIEDLVHAVSAMLGVARVDNRLSMEAPQSHGAQGARH